MKHYTQVQSPLGRDQDSFETTNMGRNRVVLLQEPEPEPEEAPVSFETELPPLYLASTTSRSLGEDEGGFVLRSSEESHTLAPSPELQSGELDSRQHELEPSLNDLELQGPAHSLPTEDSNSVIKLGVSIEEVESAARGVAGIGSGPAAAAAAAGVTEVKAAADTGEGAALYRFEYKLLGPGEAGDSAGQGSLLSLHTQSPDGLFHPEQQPTMEQLLHGDTEVLNQFKHQFGSREIVEEVEDNQLPSARQDSIEIFYIEDEVEDKMETKVEAKVKTRLEAKAEAKAKAKVTPSPPPRPRHPPPHLFPVAVPADYPADMSPITSASSVVDTVDKRYRLSIIY